VVSLHHIGILTGDLDAAAAVLCDEFGLGRGRRERLEDLGVDVQWVQSDGLRFEVISPTRDESRAAEAIALGQEGVHHLAFEVRDTDASLRQFRETGFGTLDQVSRAGVGGSRIGFLDPATTGGLRIELVSGMSEGAEGHE